MLLLNENKDKHIVRVLLRLWSARDADVAVYCNTSVDGSDWLYFIRIVNAIKYAIIMFSYWNR